MIYIITQFMKLRILSAEDSEEIRQTVKHRLTVDTAFFLRKAGDNIYLCKLCKAGFEDA